MSDVREKAILKYSNGDGMGTMFAAVIRQSDGVELGKIRYQPDSEASVNALDEHLADIEMRYQVEIVEE